MSVYHDPSDTCYCSSGSENYHVSPFTVRRVSAVGGTMRTIYVRFDTSGWEFSVSTPRDLECVVKSAS